MTSFYIEHGLLYESQCTDADPNETYDIIHSEIELNKNIHLPEKQEIFS